MAVHARNEGQELRVLSKALLEKAHYSRPIQFFFFAFLEPMHSEIKEPNWAFFVTEVLQSWGCVSLPLDMYFFLTKESACGVVSCKNIHNKDTKTSEEERYFWEFTEPSLTFGKTIRYPWWWITRWYNPTLIRQLELWEIFGTMHHCKTSYDMMRDKITEPYRDTGYFFTFW